MNKIRSTKLKNIMKGLALMSTVGAAGVYGANQIQAHAEGADNAFRPEYTMRQVKTTPDTSWGTDVSNNPVMPGSFDAETGTNKFVAFCREYMKYSPDGKNYYDSGHQPSHAAIHVLEAGSPGHSLHYWQDHDSKNLTWPILRAATQMAYWQVAHVHGQPPFYVDDYTPNSYHYTDGKMAKKLAKKILNMASNMTGGLDEPKPKLVPIEHYPKDSFQTYQGYRLEGLDGYTLPEDDTTLHVTGLPKGANVYVSGDKLGGNGDYNVQLQGGQRIAVRVPSSDATPGQHYNWNISLSSKVPYVAAANYRPANTGDQDSTVVKRYDMPSTSVGSDATVPEQKHHHYNQITTPGTPGSINVHKEDTDGTPMADTKISLYREGTDGEYHFQDALNTDGNGNAVFDNLAPGAYLVREDNTDSEHRTIDPNTDQAVEQFTDVTSNQGSNVTLQDQKIADMPHVKSFVSEDGTEDRELDAKTQDIHDELDIYHLDADHQYTVTDQLIDADTGAPANINGKTYSRSETFTAGRNDTPNGGNPQQAGYSGDKVNHQTALNVDSIPFQNMQNHRYYMQATVSSASGQPLYIERSDIDANQNLRIKNPWATSHLVNKTWEKYDDGSADKDQNKSYLDDVNPDNGQDLQDTFTEHGLVSGHSYTLTAQLMAKKSDGSYEKIDDPNATQSNTFKATDSDQTNKVDFNGVDLSKYRQQDVVVYYKLTPSDQTDDNLIDYNYPGYFGEDTETLHVTNPKTINVTKVDTKGKPMAHTKFTIYRKDQDGKLESIKSAETDDQGHLSFDNMEPAVYVVREDTTDKEHENSDDNGYNQEQTVDASDINTTNYNLTFTDVPIEDQPNVRSRTTEVGTGSRALDAKKENLQDELDFTRLDGTHQYKAVDTLMDSKTNKPVDTKANDTDDDSKAASTSKTFTAPGRHGEHMNYDFKLDFPEVDFAGKQNQDFYTQVKIYNGDGKLLRVEQSPHDVDQDLHVEKPMVETQARSDVDKDDVTGEQHINPYSKTGMVDHTISHNLVPKHQYTIHEQLMLKDGDKVSPLKIDGNEVKATKDFTADNPRMKEDVTFDKFNTEGLRGKDLVVYYQITPKEEQDDTLGKLEDKNDMDETLAITNPKIHTVAQIDDDKVSNPSLDSHIHDTVDFKGVAPNQPMDMEAVAADKDDHAIEIKDPNGKNSYLMGKTKFTPHDVSGEVEVPMEEIAASGSASSATKANSSGSASGKSAAKPSSGSSSQSSLNTSISSSQVSSASSSSSASASDGDDASVGPDVSKPSIRHDLNKLTAVDNAYAKSMIHPDELADRENHSLGRRMEEATYANNGGRSPFDIDTEGLKGQDLHLFEDMYMQGDTVPIASYDSPNDKDETVHVTNPKMATIALLDQHKLSNPNSKAFLQDKIKYLNVAPNHPIEFSIIAMNQKTGQPIVINKKGNNYNLMGRKVVTPHDPSGYAIVPLQMVQAGVSAKNNKGTNVTPVNADKIAVKNASDDPSVKGLQATANKMDDSNDSTVGVAKNEINGAIKDLSDYVYDAQTGLPKNISKDISDLTDTIGDGKKIKSESDLQGEISNLSNDITDDADAGDLVTKEDYQNWKNNRTHGSSANSASGSASGSSSSASSNASGSASSSASSNVDHNAADYIIGDNGAQASNGTSSSVSSASSIAKSNSSAASSSAGTSSEASSENSADYGNMSAVINRINENQLPATESDALKSGSGSNDNDVDDDDPHASKYAIDTTGLRGQTMTMFEDASTPGDKYNSPMSTDADLANTDESVRVTNPNIHTMQEVNNKKKDKPGHEDKDHIVDHVQFKDFAPGETAHMEAVEMDKGTGKPVLIDGQYLVGRQAFTPDRMDGRVTVNLQKQDTPPMYQYLVRELQADGMPSDNIQTNQDAQSTLTPKQALHMDGNDLNKNDVKQDKHGQTNAGNQNSVAENSDDDGDYEAGADESANTDNMDQTTDSSRNGIDLSSLLEKTGLYGKTLHWTAFETAQNNNGDDIAEHKNRENADQSIGVQVPVPKHKKPVKNVPPKIVQAQQTNNGQPYGAHPATANPGTTREAPAQQQPAEGQPGSRPALTGSYPQYARTGMNVHRHMHKHAKKSVISRLIKKVADLF